MDTQPALKAWFVGQLKTILEAIDLLQQHYVGHSFRMGVATAAALAGVEDSTIQALGRWHSSAFRTYIQIARDRLAGLSITLARSTGENTDA